MTEAEIIKMLARSLDERKYPFQLPNSFVYKWESDYWVMTQRGETREFEIKISRADFKCDSKKQKHSNSTEGANYFYYVCPENLIKPEEVDKKYGLIYVKDGYVMIIKNPRRLNDNKFKDWRMLAIKMYWKWRSLWLDKRLRKEITYQEWAEGITTALDAIK